MFALFSDGLKGSCSGKKVEYFQNMQRTVWEVMENPGWIYFENNTKRNSITNQGNAKYLQLQPTRSVALEMKILDQLVDLAPAEAQPNVLETVFLVDFPPDVDTDCWAIDRSRAFL